MVADRPVVVAPISKAAKAAMVAAGSLAVAPQMIEL